MASEDGLKLTVKLYPNKILSINGLVDGPILKFQMMQNPDILKQNIAKKVLTTSFR